MGELGVPSRLLTGRYGAPFTYATFHKDRTMAPGQLDFEAMRDLYRYDQIDAQTELYGVLADPVAHSLSPHIHNAAFQSERMNCVYLPFRVPKPKLASTLKEFEWLGVKGYSVTLPHKEAAVELAANYNGPVREIGAANTLYRNGQGGWWAANTDCDAALESLRIAMANGADAAPAALDPLSGKRVLLLGAGGAAKAIAMGVMRAGAVLTIANRTKARAAQLADCLGCVLAQWENRGAVYADILINCTSVGMHPDVDKSPFAENWLREGMVVFDTVYTPERTLLIAQARERRCRTVTGVEMFIRQAARQFELFTGRAAPIETMRAALKRAISPARTG
jgi:3-dehydroquinate dehydratase/shikimate dehydrogenase